MATKTMRPQQHRFLEDTSNDWGSQDTDDPLNQSSSSSVFGDPDPADGRPKRGSRKLLRQNAEEKYCRLESGIGSGGSLEFCSVSEQGSFEANSVSHNQHPVINVVGPSQELLDGTTMRQWSQTSSGFEEFGYLRSDSRPQGGRDHRFIPPPPRSVDRQISQASSGFGEGPDSLSSSSASRRRFLFSDKSDGSTSRDRESQDVEDPLNLSNASSVFASENTRPADLEHGETPKPRWEEVCEEFEQQLERELLTTAVENWSSVSELERYLQRGCHPRVDNNNNASRTESAAVSIPLIVHNYVSDFEPEISKSNSQGLSETFVTGPSFDENMWRMRDAQLPTNDFIDDSRHEALDPANNTATTTHHLEWAHHCGSMVARGSVKRCHLVDCAEAQIFLGWLDRCFHIGHLPDCNRCVGTLGRVLCHSEACPESHCSMPFCQIVKERRHVLGRHLSIEELKGEVSPFGKLSAMEAMSSSIHPLLDNKLDHSVPLHVLPLAFLGNFGKFNVLLAQLRRLGACSSPSQPSTVIIKKIPRRERLHPALQLIRDLSHDCLLRVVDVIEEGSHLVVLSDFVPGMTFQEMLIEREEHWPWPDHFSTIIEAVSFLHQQNILFLNWECENILLRATPQALGQGSPCLVITQGSLSLIPRGSNSFQVDEALSRALSPRIAAPEILALGEVCYSADIWGLGILLYQLAKREKPYNNLRHFTWPLAREKILQKRQPPELRGCDLRFVELLRQSLSWRPEDRPSLHAFRELFINSRSIVVEP